jgi:hypothetical protein
MYVHRCAAEVLTLVVALALDRLTNHRIDLFLLRVHLRVLVWSPVHSPTDDGFVAWLFMILCPRDAGGCGIPLSKRRCVCREVVGWIRRPRRNGVLSCTDPKAWVLQ